MKSKINYFWFNEMLVSGEKTKLSSTESGKKILKIIKSCNGRYSFYKIVYQFFIWIALIILYFDLNDKEHLLLREILFLIFVLIGGSLYVFSEYFFLKFNPVVKIYYEDIQKIQKEIKDFEIKAIIQKLIS